MDGTIDFIILEHDDVAECALIAGAVDGVVPAIDGYNTPYVVAKGNDHATRNWEDCTKIRRHREGEARLRGIARAGILA